MLNKENINKYFNLPIKYLPESNIKNVSTNLIVDLELIKSQSKKIPVYNEVFNPKSNLGEMSIVKFSKHFTDDKNFLKDSQKLYKNINIELNYDLINDMTNTWNNIKGDDNFRQKYQYIDYDKCDFLNHSSIFLGVMSFYNLSSPVLNLMIPIFVCIIPFFLLFLIGKRVSFGEYKILLNKALEKIPIGKLFKQFNTPDVSLNQKVYYIFVIGMYFFNIYQNICSCVKFYNNTNYITKQFITIKNYLDHTVENINNYLKITKNMKTYKKFNLELVGYKNRLIHFRNSIDFIPTNTMSLKGIIKIGGIMKYFYTLYSTEEVEEIFYYSYGFNGYIDCINGINRNIEMKKINKIKFSKKDVFKLKNQYHPLIKNPIKNNINMKKSKIITGPNAAGKTTILKSTIINLLLSQQIGYGYYEEGKLNPYQYMHCYINIPDTNDRDSLFQAEVRRCLDILHTIENDPKLRHFCIFDELFSGTNPYEAISSAVSYLEYINNYNVKFILTTHYIQLCEIMDTNKQIINQNMKTDVKNNVSEYFYKVIKGISKIKGGLSVLKQLNYPNEIIKRSEKIMMNVR